ncbi:MAG TPA: SRPBCC domain-containing protein [Candidatus Thermoplasmatota archaeon]|nr:SRPBCC domain-containing protein [Candidatus Thermoplasmatota archaeon]
MAPTHAAIPGSTLTLPSDTEFEIVRSFAAPRELVWRAFTDPTLLRKWSGPAGSTMTVCEMDVRPNGKFRWTFAGEGLEFTTAGLIHEVDKPRRLVMESMDPDPTPEVRTMTFEESSGRTTVTIRIKAATKEVRDAMLASGMTEGMEMTYTQLDSLLTELR